MNPGLTRSEVDDCLGLGHSHINIDIMKINIDCKILGSTLNYSTIDYMLRIFIFINDLIFFSMHLYNALACTLLLVNKGSLTYSTSRDIFHCLIL